MSPLKKYQKQVQRAVNSPFNRKSNINTFAYTIDRMAESAKKAVDQLQNRPLQLSQDSDESLIARRDEALNEKHELLGHPQVATDSNSMTVEPPQVTD
jgi:hypothetical protein